MDEAISIIAENGARAASKLGIKFDEPIHLPEFAHSGRRNWAIRLNQMEKESFRNGIRPMCHRTSYGNKLSRKFREYKSTLDSHIFTFICWKWHGRRKLSHHLINIFLKNVRKVSAHIIVFQFMKLVRHETIGHSIEWRRKLGSLHSDSVCRKWMWKTLANVILWRH